MGKVPAAVFGDDDEVRDADTAHFRVVDARLDGDDVAGDELFVYRRDTGGLVDLQPDAMPGAVEEALGERLARLLVVDVGFVSRFVQDVGYLPGPLPPAHARTL